MTPLEQGTSEPWNLGITVPCRELWAGPGGWCVFSDGEQLQFASTLVPLRAWPNLPSSPHAQLLMVGMAYRAPSPPSSGAVHHACPKCPARHLLPAQASIWVTLLLRTYLAAQRGCMATRPRRLCWAPRAAAWLQDCSERGQGEAALVVLSHLQSYHPCYKKVELSS